MTLLWLSNPPWFPSGYGEQAGLFLPRLRGLGHDVHMLCNWGMHGGPIDWNGIACYSCDGLWGNRSLPAVAAAVGADQVVALCDAFVLRPNDWPDELEVAVWAPIDHYPVPRAVLQVLAHPQVTPIAMSRFGQEMLADQDVDALYVPHGVDTDMFRPRPDLQAQVRQGLQLPADAFVAGVVAANNGNPFTPRKAFPQILLAFTRFAAQHDDAFLYLHTDFAPQGVGMDLNVACELAGGPPGRIRYPDPAGFQIGLPREAVALTYQAFDVLLNPSMGEGFGLPILEAQACGVPVISSDHSAMRELTEAGWLVDGDPWLDYAQQAWLINPSIGSIVAALEDAYQARSDRRLRERAVEFAAQYDADLVTDLYWRPALDELAERVRAAA